MDPRSGREDRRPRGLRSPFYGDTGSIVIIVDVGPDTSMNTIFTNVADLNELVDLGTLWGDVLAESSAQWDLAYEVQRGDLRAIDRLLDGSHIDPRLRDEVFEWIHMRPPWRGWWSSHPAWEQVQYQRASELRGRPPRVRSLRYENPLELVLYGSGPLMGGVILVARMIRDWSAQRRLGAAAAREAEARARIVETEADRAEIATEMLRWFAEEERAGRGGLPQFDLLKALTPHHAQAINHLAEQDVKLALPGDPAQDTPSRTS